MYNNNGNNSNNNNNSERENKPSGGRFGASFSCGARDTMGGILQGFSPLPSIRKITMTVKGRPRSTRNIISQSYSVKKNEFFTPSKRPSTAPYANHGNNENSMRSVLSHDVIDVRGESGTKHSKFYKK